MFDFEKLNHKGGFDIDTTGFDYRDLEDVYDVNSEDPIPVFGAYLTVDKRTESQRRLGKGIGPHPVLIMEDYFLNLPGHLYSMWKQILDDEDAVEAIKNGELGITIYTYEKSGYNKEFYSIKLWNI